MLVDAKAVHVGKTDSMGHKSSYVVLIKSGPHGKEHACVLN